MKPEEKKIDLFSNDNRIEMIKDTARHKIYIIY